MKIIKILSLILFALAANGEDMSSSMKVAIDDVLAAGKVTPVDGVTSTGQPDEAALKIFADSGYVAVIDLRTAEEERGIDEVTAVEAAGMEYVSLPIAGATAVNFENAARLDEYLAGIDGPVMIHCGVGNRVGALLALRQSLKGEDDETAIAYGKAGGLTRLEPRVREVLEAD